MSSPVPMNREQRRKVKTTFTPETVPLQVRVYGRKEWTTDDGTILAQTYLQPIAPNGQGMFDMAQDGTPAPVLIKCEPVVMGRSLIARIK